MDIKPNPDMPIDDEEFLDFGKLDLSDSLNPPSRKDLEESLGVKYKSDSDITDVILEKFSQAILDGDKLARLGKIDQAYEVLSGAVDLAIRKNIEIAALYSTFSMVQIHKGDLNGALKSIDRAIEIDPSAGDFYLRGRIHYDKGDLEGCLKNFREALKLKPDDIATWIAQALVMMTKGDISEAMKSYDMALELDPTNAEIWYSRGGALILESDKKRVEIPIVALLAKKSIKKLDDVIKSRDNYIDEAVQSYEKAIELKPDYAHASFSLGTALLSKDEEVSERAIKSLDRALELDPKLVESQEEYFSQLFRRYHSQFECTKKLYRLIDSSLGGPDSDGGSEVNGDVSKSSLNNLALLYTLFNKHGISVEGYSQELITRIENHSKE